MIFSNKIWYVFIVLQYFFFFKQKTAYEMRISDWSSEVCSSDLAIPRTASRLASASRRWMTVGRCGSRAVPAKSSTVDRRRADGCQGLRAAPQEALRGCRQAGTARGVQVRERHAGAPAGEDRKSVVRGKGEHARVELGAGR